MTRNNQKDNTFKSNAQALDEAGKVQDRTLEALLRIQQQAAQTEELGVETLQELREQRLQMEKIGVEARRVDENLTKVAQLQNRLDRWAGRWGGRDKRAAKAQVKREMKLDYEHNRIEKEKKSSARNAAAVSSISTDTAITSARITTTTSSSFAHPRKSKRLVKRPLKKNPVVDSNVLQADKSMDAETKEGLQKIAEKDDLIDSMLDQTALSVDCLANISRAISEETRQQDEKLENLTGTMENSNEKQRVVNNRVNRFLGGHWRKDPVKKASDALPLTPSM